VTYEVDGYCYESEKEQKKRWKASQSSFAMVSLSSEEAYVLVEPCQSGVLNQFTISFRGVAGVGQWSGKRSLADLEILRHELEEECSVKMAPLPLQHDIFKVQPVLPILQSCKSFGMMTALQQWLADIISDKRVNSHAFQKFIAGSSQANSSSSDWESPARVALNLPILSEIVEYLDEPRDIAHICTTVSKSIKDGSRTIYANRWEQIYQEKWPAFYAAQSHSSAVSQLATDWQAMYRHTLAGKCEVLLEIFDREKKLGFAMSCMMARVTWEASSSSYLVQYVSASQVFPERIPAREAKRLRFCPPSARAQLKPELQPPQVSEFYAYRILEGVPELAIGQGIELQWKMQLGSPFGWWYGKVESIERHTQNGTASVTMTFPHFPQSSRWYRLRVTVGDGDMHSCSIGGYHGGVRAATEAESKVWMQFFPKDPVIF